MYPTSSGAGGAGQQQKAEGENQEPPEAEEEDDEKLGAKGVLQLIAFGVILCVVFVCGYFITMELMPSRMSPNTVMNKAHDAFLADPDVSTVDALVERSREVGKRHELHRRLIFLDVFISQYPPVNTQTPVLKHVIFLGSRSDAMVIILANSKKTSKHEPLGSGLEFSLKVGFNPRGGREL